MEALKLFTGKEVQNVLINAEMRHWQRTTSVTSAGSFHVADRWRLENSTGATMLYDRVTDVPPGTSHPYSIRLRNTTTATPTGINRLTPHQVIEESITRRLFGKRLFYSGWLKATYNCQIPVFVYLGASPATSFTYITRTVNLVANTWTRFSFDLGIPLTFNKALLDFLAINGPGGYVGFHLDAGPGVTGVLPEVWTTLSLPSEPIRMGTGQTKMLTTLNREIQYTGFTLGTSPEFGLAGGGDATNELALCQRYFQRGFMGALGLSIGGTTGYLTGDFAVDMRALPLYGLNPDVSLTNALDEVTVSPRTITGVSNLASSTRGYSVVISTSAAMTANRFIRPNVDFFYADAEF